jgi:NADH:ubiquinone oxidoreductase subunit 4 (subunit M)
VLMLLSLVATIVTLGLYPQPVLDLAERPVALVQQYYAPASSQTGATAP